MATIKSYTDLEQSKKLVGILSLESADMSYYLWKDDGHLVSPVPFVLDGTEEKENGLFEYIPCWSLTTLFSVLPKYIGDYSKCLYYDIDGYYCGYMDDGNFMLTIEETNADNPVDACYEMIIKLNELKLL